MKTIFDPVMMPGLSMKNRIVRSATWETLTTEDGGPSDEQIHLYETLAKGNVGAIINGFTSTDDDDRYFHGMARMSRDELIEKWKPLVDVVHKEGVKIIMQSALGEFVRRGRALEPDDVTVADIREIVELFVSAAVRASTAGFDGVQIHAAHGFYLSRFISPAFNHRVDEYGGDAHGRARIVADIVRGIRKAAPALHVTMKINGSDFMPGGTDVEDFVSIVRFLEEEGLQSVEVSGNGTSVPGIRAGKDEAYFLPFALALKEVSSIPTILVGGFRSVEVMNAVAERYGIELFALSRPLIREPHLAARWEEGDLRPSLCISCNQCYRTEGHRCFFCADG